MQLCDIDLDAAWSDASSILDCVRSFHICWRGRENHKAFGGNKMGKRDELIMKYASDLKEKCGVTPDIDLLRKVTVGCGPSIYNADASTVSGSDKTELATVKKSFLIKKLGLRESDELDSALGKVMETYGRSNRNKYRAVVYYLLTKQFGKESVYR